MSILPPVARLILAAHKRSPLTGNILTIGRQSVPMSAQDVSALMAEQDIPIRADCLLDADTETVGANPDHLTDRAFFSMFTDAKVWALDVSPYEKATILHDLNEDVPETLTGIADFIFDGSCLDNLFDPARALKSMSKMLRPGGRILGFEHATPIQSAYLCYSPDWFWDFFTANGYADVKVWTCAFRFVLSEWRVMPWLPGVHPPSGDFTLVFEATKTKSSTDERTPIQAHYRKLHG